MKFGGPKMAGGDQISARDRLRGMRGKTVFLALFLLTTAGLVSAQMLYKYRGPDGEWMYSDRPPDDGSIPEIRQLESGQQDSALSVTHEFAGRTAVLVAHNKYYAPVELVIKIQSIRGLHFPDPDLELRWVVPPRSDLELFGLDLLEDVSTPFLEYQYQYLAGEPNARHQPLQAYRAPFAIASSYPVSQAYPKVATHTAPDSFYAVDLAMPIGTDIVAARGGVVFDVASSNFRAGLDPERDGPAANVVRIMHDDGTYALYAHLNTNSIRVRPGDRVERGDYIADSGNTGFSSGPHLHFAVMRNVGLRIESLPFVFMGANANAVVPATGMMLTAY
jgi:murein DD-endopeptidase MepM/ murein hydrolase activator NlpD